MPPTHCHVLGDLGSKSRGVWCVMRVASMALVVAPSAGCDHVFRGVEAAIGLRLEMFGRAVKVLGQPDRYT